jgi:hypothetical protein
MHELISSFQAKMLEIFVLQVDILEICRNKLNQFCYFEEIWMANILFFTNMDFILGF